jgi:hypothetical protein
MRRFTQDEMSEILRIASAGEAQDAVGVGTRLSLSEIQKAGAELGYDPARVEAAAQLVASRKQQSHPLRHEFDVVLPSRPSDTAWEEIVMELRKELKLPGAVRDRSDGGKEWIAASAEQTVSATMFPSPEGWHVAMTFDAKPSQTIWLIMACSGFVFLSMNALNSIGKRGWGAPDTVIALTLLVMEVVLAVAAIVWGKRRVKTKAETLARSIREIATQGCPVQPPVTGTAMVDEQHVQA